MTSPKIASAERRATLLNAAARVAKNVTSILDPDQLLQRTVDIICDEFGFYYAGVFLVDDSGQWAVLRSGRGEAGRAMIKEGHKLAVSGNSMIGAATGRREARIALDVGEEAVFFKNPHLPHTRSEMALPLIVGDEVIGALTVQSVEEAAFTQEDIATLQTMADQLAIAIQNSRLHRKNRELLRQAERRARLLHAATQVGKQVTSILDIDHLLPETVNVICREYGFYYAGVFLLDDNKEWAVLRAGYGEAGKAMLKENHRLKVGGNSMIGAATSLGEARIALDVGEERVFFKNPHLPNTRSEMALPLMVGKEILGAVTVQSVEERAFNQDDITTLQTMADHLAVAINNARNLRALEIANAELTRTRVYEALTAATTEAIHWIGNKALPLTMTVARMKFELDSGVVDVESLKEDLDLVAQSAALIIEVKENLLGPAREQKPRPAMLPDILQAAACHRGVNPAMFEMVVHPDTPLVLGDTTQLGRAFGNLLQNALEAGATQIRAEIEPAAQPGMIAIRLHDNGCGIPADKLDSIWATFITTKGVNHHGLGLPACLHVISQHQGSISASSVAGEGTTFNILLPAAPEMPVTEIAFAGPQRVLLLDDDDAWSNFAADLLADAGKMVTRRSAPRIESDVDLVFLDDALQQMSLPDVMQALSEAGMLQKTIVVAAALSVERTTAYLKAGVRDVVLKPYTAAELAQILAAAQG